MTYDALLVLSFGGPEGPADVMPFLANVTRGRTVPPERLAEVAAHYARFGGVSPINAANRALVAALRGPLPVYWGNRNWHPLLTDAVREMANNGVRRAVCFVTSAYSGYSSCRQYLQDIERARAAVGAGAPTIDKLRPFYDHPGFVDPMARGVRAALSRVPPGSELVFSAHSIPLAQAATSDYAPQVEEASRLVAAAAGFTGSWSVAWQSRSGPPEQPWLEPDVGDQLVDAAARGAPGAVVVPIGFIADHMEVVYDLDVVALERGRAAGLAVVRAPTVGTDPEFVAMVHELVAERADPATPVRWLGRFGPRADLCGDGCCPAPARAGAAGEADPATREATGGSARRAR